MTLELERDGAGHVLIAGALREMESEPWAMHPPLLQALAEKLGAFTLGGPALATRVASAAGSSESTSGKGYELRGSKAVVRVSGTLMRSVPRWHQWYGVDSTSTSALRDSITKASEDPAVSGIVLAIDSPGGQASGVLDVGEAVSAARKRKPVHAVVESMAASGAYWIASQADTITATRDSMLGSIGCYQVLADWSKAAEKAGVKVTVVRSGVHKGAGVTGAPITDEQVASVQSLVDSFAGLFREAVARGRRMSAENVNSVATGEVWLAAESQSKGLVDHVEPVAKAFSRLAPQERIMTNEEIEQLKSTARNEALASEKKRTADILGAFPKHPAFAAAQVASGATLEASKAAYADVLSRELDDERAKSAKAQDEVNRVVAASREAETAAKAKAASAPRSAAPVPAGADPSAASGLDFMTEARRVASERKVPLSAAMGIVARSNPALHEAYVSSQPSRPLSEKPQRV